MVVVTEKMRMDSAMRCRCLLLAFVVTAAAARRLDPVASSHGRELGENGDGDLGGLSRERFPKGFVFGTGSSAYQYEGAASEDGRGPSVWDTNAHRPGAVLDNTTGDVAVDQYHRYKEDIQLMKDLNMDAYRFSISWSRIFPDGVGPEPNPEGVAYYNRFINELQRRGIEPYATLYHWDLPQALNDTIGGWGSPDIVAHFARFADVCFANFGDRVKHWITFNEPFGFLTYRFNAGTDCGFNCTHRPQTYTTEYTEGHHVLLSHSMAVQLYRKKYQATQGGMLGVALDANLYWPLTNTTVDVEAAARAQLFEMGWWLDPMFFGDYPEVMKQRLGLGLPKFTQEESRLLKGSLDYVGVNHYTTWYVTNKSSDQVGDAFFVDPAAGVTPVVVKDGIQIGPQAASVWLFIVPWGMQSILNWVRIRYNNPPVFILENVAASNEDIPMIVCVLMSISLIDVAAMDDEAGVDTNSNLLASMRENLNDEMRIQVHRDYLQYVLAAIKDGCDVRGYFVWSLLDNFEWSSGFTVRFGLYYVDFVNGLKRYPKASALWFQRLLQTRQQNMISDH